MSWPRLKMPLSLSLSALLLAAAALVVHAQGERRLLLSDPQIADFPLVSLFAQVLDANGTRVEGLRAADFLLTEDGNPAGSLAVSEALVGARLIFAINTDASLRIRDTLGRSRFDLARQALLAWWQQPESTRLGLDELTLLDSEQVLIAASDSVAELASSLEAAAPTFDGVDTGYELLFRALDFASEPTSRPGMPTSMIFMTSLLRQPRDIPLTNIITRARGTGTAVYPVVLGPIEPTDQPEVEILQRLAQETGGQLIFFDEAQGLSALAARIGAGRTQYRLSYESAASDSGPHEIRVQLVDETGEGPAATSSFVLDIQPPEVTLLNLPASILRSTDDPAVAPESIPPTSLVVDYAVRFPDGYARQVELSQLIVDGLTASQSTQPPFETLTWDLSGLLENGVHDVQVAVTDSLGLRGTSPSARIEIEVQRPPGGLAAIRPALGSLLLALAVLGAGVALAAYLISGRQPRLRTIEQPRLQPRPSILRRAALQRELPDEPAEAMLVPLTGADDSPDFIPLVGMDTILGRDPSLAAIPIDDPSVDRLHARLIRQADGEYLIRDQGSTAGTWVNYREVPAAGVRLQHGDIVQLGEIAFRFEYIEAPAPRRVNISPDPAPAPSQPQGKGEA